MEPGVRLRRARADDEGFLTEMLAEAAAWRDDVAASFVEVTGDPRFAHYVVDWPRAGDRGIVAAEAGRRVGAAWYRFFPADDEGFGFVAADIPELSIAVIAERRGQGIGRRLLRELLRVAFDEECRGVSLSVEPDNPARALYSSMGFRVVGTNGGALTMVAEATDGRSSRLARGPDEPVD